MNYLFTSDGDVDCFQFLAIMNRAAVNVDELVSLNYIVESFVYIPKSAVAESYGKLIFSTYGLSTGFQQGLYQFAVLPAVNSPT